jgi:site-specific recombinase XerD
MSDDLEPLAPETGIERFLEHYRPGVRESTFRKAKSRLSFFRDWLDEREIENLNTLTGRDLSDFVAWRRGHDIAAITLQKNLGTIREALRYWADIEAVTDGLAEKVHSPELPDGSASRDEHLDADRAEAILEYLDRFEYASRRHAVLSLLWRTGMRRSALRSLDLRDLRPDENAVVLQHRPETDTKLKNGEHGERWVFLGPIWYQVVDDWVAANRHDVADDHGRDPLITTKEGRASATSIYDWVNHVTQPCEIGDCPHGRDPKDCEAREPKAWSKCPSARSPHPVRRGAITHHLNESVSPDTVSERMDVSLEVLYKHYDARTPREKMAVRKGNLEGVL